VRDNSSTLIVAGSETTATILAGVTYLLARNPEVLKKLTDEVRSSFQHESEITVQGVARLPYLLSVLDEALRMYPPVPVSIPRVMNPQGGMVGGHYLPPKVSTFYVDTEDEHYWLIELARQAIVGISQYTLFRNPNYFAFPDSFTPERWSEEDTRFANDKKHLFQPFSFGPRNCLGRK
jgi:cytochrome P450